MPYETYQDLIIEEDNSLPLFRDIEPKKQKGEFLVSANDVYNKLDKGITVLLSFDYALKNYTYEHFLFYAHQNRDRYVLDELTNNQAVIDLHTFRHSDYDYDVKRSISLLRRYLGVGIIHRPDPNRFIKPTNFSADTIGLIGDCSNLIQFLFYLNTNYKRAYLQIESDLAKCVGDIISLSTPPVKVGNESKLGLKFFGKNDEDFWAEDVSEGVLYFLALLTIVNQPNPPKLLMLEEPEKGIHPRRIYEVIQFILRLVEEKDIQVIMTTHSPVVLDMFADMPESVFIFDKDEEGATHVKNLQRDVIEPDTEKSKEFGMEPPHYTDALGDSWTIGFLGGVPK
ncbi:hypothetical protein GCM10027423_46430 [Spirosoma arcticum]